MTNFKAYASAHAEELHQLLRALCQLIDSRNQFVRFFQKRGNAIIQFGRTADQLLHSVVQLL